MWQSDYDLKPDWYSADYDELRYPTVSIFGNSIIMWQSDYDLKPDCYSTDYDELYSKGSKEIRVYLAFASKLARFVD